MPEYEVAGKMVGPCANILKKLLIGAPLMYLSLLTLTCPCEKLLSCHKSHVYGSLLIFGLFFSVENQFNFALEH